MFIKISKEFKFSSIRNIRDNWHIFDPKLNIMKVKIEEKQQNDLLQSFKPGGFGGLDDIFKTEEAATPTSNDISPY